MEKPLSPQVARQRLTQILISGGEVSFSKHALAECATDQMTTVDCVNVLRGGAIEPADFISGTWRYRVRTAKLSVVFAFRSESRCVVVTAWRDSE